MNQALANYAEILAISLATLENHAPKGYYKRPKAQPRACDKKKCKSCKFYVKSNVKYAITHCKKGIYLRNPLQVACDRYEKRK